MPSWKKVITSGSDARLNSLNVTAHFTASGLIYPSADNGESSFIQTDGNGKLSLQYVNTMYETVYNAEATTIVKGTPLYVSGSQGANSRVFRADAGNPSKMPVIYVAADNIAAADTGRGAVLGLIAGVDTTGYPPGTEIYVAVGGGWTSTRPTGTAIIQSLGIVTKEGAGGQGLILNPGPANLPNLTSGSLWVGNSNGYPTAVATASLRVLSSSFATTASYVLNAISASYAPTIPAFPFTGSAGISGSLTLNGPTTIDTKGLTAGLSINGDTIGTIVLKTTGSSGFSITADSSNGFSIYDINDTRTRFYMSDGGGFGFNTTDVSGYNLNVSGSSRFTNNVDITGSLNVINGITGSLLGTASYALNADTLDGLDSADFVQTNGDQSITGEKSFRNTTFFGLGSGAGLDGKITLVDGTNDIKTSLTVDSEGNIVVQDASNVSLATIYQNGDGIELASGTFIGDLTGNADTATTASFASTASFVRNAISASYASNALSSSFASTASFVNRLNQNVTIVGNQTITGSVSISSALVSLNITSSQARISGSGNVSTTGPVLTVLGSGSGYPVFTVQGSQGELFSVSDSLTGSLFSVSDISGLPILEVFSDDSIVMGDYQAPSLFATKRHTSTVGVNNIYSIPTSSYNGAFFDYVVTSASNARAGNITAIALGTSIQYNETTTMDIGNTSGVNFMVRISGNDMVLTGSFTTANWVMKTIIRSI